MGLIKAGLGAAGSVLADQWKEYFYCEAIPADVLAVKGRKKVSDRSSNYKGDENIITNGSVIAVADGQCMLIVEQGKVVEVCAEPGEYTYDTSTEPSIFAGDLVESIGQVFRNIGKRFTFGGEAPKDQRIYYFNTKEIVGNKYGTPSPVPFRVVDQRAGLDMDIGVRCFGEYSFRIVNPLLFYTNVCGNVDEMYSREEIAGQMRTELLTALQPAFAKISAMQAAASNPNAGPAMAFMGMGMAGQMGGMNAQSLYQIGVQEQPQPTTPSAPVSASSWVCSCGQSGITGRFCPNCGGKKPEQKPSADSWRCQQCGAVVSGNFCPECGTKKPDAQSNGWTCSCGAMNKGKFCAECGKPKPAGVPQYRCDQCGWEPDDPQKPPKFCPECGDPFDDGDLQE